MKQRILVGLAAIVSFSVLPIGGATLSADMIAGLPHTVGLQLEPDSVSVGSPAKITLTFIPCVDVESLSISVKICPEADVQLVGPLQGGWWGNGRNEQAISISGVVVFQRPGYYGVNVEYELNRPGFSGDSVS